uniref:Uncharacterized protein n=1 Tax=Coccidioides posadasii RMSCC 3488 TaxID=454284 RepID=A0A0J6FUA2_COCPO|nr:hypothetical protein CPAG_09260 [Coccidioides posadasii RMSCC 3488]
MDPLWTRRNANPSQDVTALLPRIKGRVVALEHGPKSGQLDLSPININHGLPRFGVRGWLDPWMYTPCLVCMYTEYCMLLSTLPLSDFQSQAPGNVFNDVTILDTNILRPHSQNNHSSGEKSTPYGKQLHLYRTRVGLRRICLLQGWCGSALPISTGSVGEYTRIAVIPTHAELCIHTYISLGKCLPSACGRLDGWRFAESVHVVKRHSTEDPVRMYVCMYGEYPIRILKKNRLKMRHPQILLSALIINSSPILRQRGSGTPPLLLSESHPRRILVLVLGSSASR